MNKIIFFSLVFINAICNAQNFNLDVDVKPNPLKSLYHEEKPKLLKKEIRLQIINEGSNNRKDTLGINYYDKEGNIISEISYNVLKSYKRDAIIHRTFKKGLIIEKKVMYIDPKNKTNYHKYIYDDQNNCIRFDDYTIKGMDTTSVLEKRWKYDRRNNLIEKKLYTGSLTSILLSAHSQKAVMSYNNKNQLIQHTHVNPSATYTPISKYYYTNNNLDSLVLVYKTEDKEIRISSTKFEYDKNNNLIYEEERRSERKAINYYHYKYENNILTEAKHFIDSSLSITVNYSYKNGYLTLLEAIKRSENYYGPLYYFPNRYTSVIKVEYVRSKEGLLMEEYTYMDDVLNKTNLYQYEYY